MKDNVFMVSDASFKNDRTAILAVKDMYTGKTKQKVVNIKIQSSLRAEELALRYAIELAINAEYKHVIFIYDCLAMNVDKFKKRYEKYFKSMQFLWLKRKHISDIDKVTKFQEDERIIAIRDIPENIRDKTVIEILSNYVATDKEIKIFTQFIKKDFKISKANRTGLFNLFYYLLSKNGKKIAKRIFKEELTPIELKKVFASKHSKEYFGLAKQIEIKEEFIFNMLRLRGKDK